MAPLESQDPAFKNVRIHSYGYDSDYLKGKEVCLNIHHIGKSFLGAISTSPYLVDPATCIVAIGHSMGGLVIKKAYIMARQDAAHKALAGRFAAVYFLATPHRGADSAKMLKNILKVAYDRAYVADLERNSGAIQVTSKARTLWVKGKPATGKSVLAGYVIDHLQESNQAYSDFFFKHGDKSKSSLGGCLRSLAFQMACSDPEARNAVREMQADGIRLGHLDDRTLWSLLFSSSIFQTAMTQHY